LFYTTFLVLFYVLVPQKVTTKGLREKHVKNSHKNAPFFAEVATQGRQKDANFLTTDYTDYTD
jgi:hypothetical protein